MESFGSFTNQKHSSFRRQQCKILKMGHDNVQECSWKSKHPQRAKNALSYGFWIRRTHQQLKFKVTFEKNHEEINGTNFDTIVYRIIEQSTWTGGQWVVNLLVSGVNPSFIWTRKNLLHLSFHDEICDDHIIQFNDRNDTLTLISTTLSSFFNSGDTTYDISWKWMCQQV